MGGMRGDNLASMKEESKKEGPVDLLGIGQNSKRNSKRQDLCQQMAKS